MSSIYMAGDYFNMVVPATLTPSSADANFGVAFLNDRKQGSVFRFAAAAANDNVIIDMNHLLNGDFEGGFVSGVPINWKNKSTGTGALSEETTLVDEGASALKLSAGASGVALARQDIIVEPAWGMTITAALRGGTGTTSIRVYNVDTGKYLTAAEAWSTSVSDWFTRSTATYLTDGPSTFTVEAASVAERSNYRLRVDVRNASTNGVGYVDDFAIWPHWNLAALYGAEYPPSVTARIRSDDNAAMSSATNRVAFTFGRPGIYGEPASTVTERYGQLYFDGTATAPISATQLALGVKRTLPRGVMIPFRTKPNVALLTSAARGGRQRPVSLERDASRDFLIRLRVTSSQLDTLRREFLDAIRYGGGEVMIVPREDRPEIYYGWVDPPNETSDGLTWTIETNFHGYGFPVQA